MLPPKDLPDAKQGKTWGCTEYVQNCHHKYYDVVLPGQNFVFAPCAACMGIFYLREVMCYEEDTLYYAGKGQRDP